MPHPSAPCKLPTRTGRGSSKRRAGGPKRKSGRSSRRALSSPASAGHDPSPSAPSTLDSVPFPSHCNTVHRRSHSKRSPSFLSKKRTKLQSAGLVPARILPPGSMHAQDPSCRWSHRELKRACPFASGLGERQRSTHGNEARRTPSEVKLELLALEDVAVCAPGLAGSGGDGGVEAAREKLRLEQGVDLGRGLDGVNLLLLALGRGGDLLGLLAFRGLCTRV
jgi:hypothetical protein